MGVKFTHKSSNVNEPVRVIDTLPIPVQVKWAMDDLAAIEESKSDRYGSDWYRRADCERDVYYDDLVSAFESLRY